MRLTVKVLAQEDPLPGTNYASLLHQFEVVVEGDKESFLDITNRIIGILPKPKPGYTAGYVMDSSVGGSIV